MVEKNSKLGFVVAGLLLGILMASMDNTIVVTAMGTIVGDLGGLENFVWVVSAYMVAEMQACRFSVSYQICMVERDSLFSV